MAGNGREGGEGVGVGGRAGGRADGWGELTGEWKPHGLLLSALSRRHKHTDK